MEESWLNIISRKTLLVLGRNLDLEAGELGQMEVDIEIEGTKIISEEIEDDVLAYHVRVSNIINVSTSRRRRVQK